MSDDDRIRDSSGEYIVHRDTLREFNAILQRDATDTTYKYALLRALVEIAEQESHHVRPVDSEWVSFPLGLIVERWLHYYYPFIERRLPQRHGESPGMRAGTRLAFRLEFQRVTDWYARHGGRAAFALDLNSRGVPAELKVEFLTLLKKLRQTITQFPMKYLGVSWYGAHYQIVNWNRTRRGRILASPLTRELIIAGLGEAYLQHRYYETFRAVGGFATGAESIFAQWARFTSTANPRQPVTLAEATEALLTVPVDDRNVKVAERVYRELLRANGKLECVWSGKSIAARSGRDGFAIDHAIPYSLWGNNALWNLLPAAPSINSQKADRIPDPELIRARSARIREYWQSLRRGYPGLFESEFRVSLSGMNADFDKPHWTDAGIDSLATKCAYLIEQRGFPSWAPPA